jgi:hypothetical protein
MEAVKTTGARRPALSPGLTSLAEEIIADDPDFVPLKPGEHRPPDYYLVEHYFGVARKPRRRKGRLGLSCWLGLKRG